MNTTYEYNIVRKTINKIGKYLEINGSSVAYQDDYFGDFKKQYSLVVLAPQQG